LKFFVGLPPIAKHFDMKHKPVLLAAFAVLLLGLSGCASATKDFSKRLRGTWQIVNYNVERPEARSAAPAPDYGSITFNKDYSGSLDNSSIFDNLSSRQGQYRFRWSNTENIVVIKGEGSGVSKSWIVVTNKKDQQVWKSTDGANKVSTLELRR
jgi:hypothetical protein